MNELLKMGGVIALFSQPPFNAKLITANMKHFRYEWIWQKSRGTGFLNANKMPLKLHENILIFYDKLPTYNPQMWKSTPYKNRHKTNGDGRNYGKFERVGMVSESVDGKRYPVDVINFTSVNNSAERQLHPTQKPVPLLEYLIKTYTNEGETVLDNCMGSGSTGVACVNTSRDFIGIELDEDYYNIAVNRINQAMKEKEVKTNAS